jgi:hypothetical protein
MIQYHKLEVNFKYDFSELKAGDKFAYQGIEYEKISGNLAESIRSKALTEINPEEKVYLYELG